LNIHKFHSVFLAVAAIFMLHSCSQKSNSWTSKAYHNTTSRYNHYFIARETMKEAEQKLFKQNKDDYTQVLEVMPRVDQASSVQMAAAMEEVIKKASVNAVWHKNSKWLDDSYNLIGKARFYKLEFPNSLETYKYVNSKGEDINARHTAMIGMLRVFTLQNDDYYAGAVIDFMDNKEKNKVNKRDYYLAKGHYHQQKREWEETAEALQIAVPLVKKGEKRAKIYYILGQIHQELGNDSAAFQNYRKCLKNNPNFEMTFYAQLNKNSVFKAQSAEEEEKVMKYYRKLLADGKNKDYKDKIYYEMAKFVWKRNRTDETLDYLKKSVRASTTNNFQKGASYLMTANIYYENLKKFPLAKAYYDSTLTLMDKKNPLYNKYKHRSEILTELVKQLDIITREDSLQRLAKMSTTELDAVFAKMIENEEKEAKEKAKRAKEAEDAAANAASRGGGANTIVDPNAAQGAWYFYNASSVTLGRGAFTRKWGNRTLTDYWRVESKFQDVGSSPVIEEEEEKKPVAKKSKEEEEQEKQEALGARKKQFMEGIPATQEQMDSSNAYVRRAMFKVGNIYNLELEEPDNALPEFEKTLARYPEHEKRLEIWYSLYLIYKNKAMEAESDKYKELILANYPTSIYAKLILNPNYLVENRELNEKAETAYKYAYQDYLAFDYETCVAKLNDIQVTYPDNNINDKIDYLKALIIGKTENAVKFKDALLAVKDKHKRSTLVPIIDDHVEKCNAYISNFIKSEYLQTDSVKKYPYFEEYTKTHVVVAAFLKRQQVPIEEINNRFMVYNTESAQTENYFAGMDEIGSEYLTVNIGEFANKADAMRYYKLKDKRNFPLNAYKEFNSRFFVISEDNLEILKNLNDMNGYMDFFNEKYLK
jgi:tetratricopeptide (TPR) repeat protein